MMQPTHDDTTGKPETFPRRPNPAARQTVDRKTRFSGLVGCLLFGLIFVATLAAVVGFIAASVMLDSGSEYLGIGLVVVVLVSATPWVVHMARKASTTRKILATLPCPECGGATTLTVESTNVYALLCRACRVVWVTDVGAPSSSDHHHRHAG